MGAYKNFIDSVKAYLAGTSPFGGTIVPTSETFPVVIAQHVQGGHYSLTSIAELADIPLQNLQLAQEVVISGVRYRLFNMPGQVISSIPGYDIEDYWEIVEGGGDPVPGPPGDDGWTPYYGTETDGPNRVVQVLLAYIGGEGTPPALPQPSNRYVGPAGLTTKSAATNIKGNKGDAGDTSNFRPMAYFFTGGRRTIPPTQVWTGPQGEFLYGTPAGFKVDNTFDQPRLFCVMAEMPLSNDSGNDSWVAMLLVRNDNGWLADQSGKLSQTRLDQNYSRTDFVNAAAFPSVHKIKLNGMIAIPPGQSRYLRVMFTQTAGTSSYYDTGFIEAFGI